MIELWTLKNFLRTASLGSISRAALELRVAQPALSRQLRQLEAEIGAALFVRTGRGVVLTEAGEHLRQDLTVVIQKLDDALIRAGSDNATPTGEVMMGALPNLGAKFYSDLILECRRRYPGIKLTLLEGYSHQNAERLQMKAIDVGFVYDPANYKNLNTETLFQEQGWLVGPATGWTLGSTVPFADLQSLPLIVTAASSLTRRKIEKACRASSVDLTYSHEVDSYEVIRRLILMGYGYSVFTYSAIWELIADGTFTAAGITDPSIDFQLALVTGNAGLLSRATHQVIALTQQLMREYHEEGRWRGAFVRPP